MRIGRLYITTKDLWTEARGFELSWYGGRTEWAFAFGFDDAPRRTFRRIRRTA